jgi:tetratricopeptide (TPR) repeat protein
LLLAGAVLAVYSRTWGADFEFVNYDDDYYVTANAHVQSGLTADGLRWAFTSLDAFNWHPLTWLSLQLDAQWFGISASGFHRTNALLQAATTVLLFWLLKRITGSMWCSAAAAAFFGLHPAHVESVAWVTARKDVLSTPFWLLTTAAYAWYAERPAVSRYFSVMLLLPLGLMAKPMLVTLPATLLLLDYWPLRRWPYPVLGDESASRYMPASLRWLVLEKVPLFALVIPSALVTVRAQSWIMGTLAEYSLWDRVANALVSYVRYLGMLAWPVELAVFYPHPRAGLPLWQPLASGVLLVAVTACCLWAGRSRRYLIVGWLWYLGTLVPVIGLAQSGQQALADKYSYVPSIGVFIMAAWGGADLCARGQVRRVFAGILTGAALACCVFLTWRQIDYWRDSETLWRHSLAVTGSNGAAHAMLAMALAEKGQFLDAVEQFQLSLELTPDNPATHGNLAVALMKLGRLDEAASHLEQSLRLRPEAAKTHFNLGHVRQRQRRLPEAVQHYTDALRLDPHLTEAGIACARVLTDLGEFAQARQQLDLLLNSDPASPHLYTELGRLLKAQGKLAEALEWHDRALEKQPNYAEAWNNKGVALEGLGKLSEAAACYQRAVEQAPSQLVYRLNLGYVQHERGELAASAEHYQAAFQIQAGWPQVALAEAWALATHPDDRRRNGALALRTAKLVCQATNYQMLQGLEALAAAHAEFGRFDDAVAGQREVVARLPRDIAPQIREAAQERLRLYQKQQPYRQPEPQKPRSPQRN